MKLIACCSFKGGAGKTTALMGLCSSLAFNQKKVALFDADENRPLTKWKENALRNDAWDPQCEVFVADELPLLEDVYEQAEVSGFDYALADTHGGASELNGTIIASSDFLLVPTMLTPLDIDEALATYRYIIELLLAEGLQTHTAILRQRVPTGRLTVSQQAAYDVLDVLPLFDTSMYERDAFAAIKERGMLHMTVANMARNPAMRLMFRNNQRALDELAVIGAFVEKALEG
ncbi:conjugal transfer ATPase VirC1 [Microvirga tunisiensis]|uniref:Conjugal transfer ATPase VirC1 n=1 Tax=Microvirga tunisiensis TaxID=2108360 RepID=A0A5N7MSS1_9HYPH|nr:conjugal transfer ATPase VirC1 [Microvirga tunisiensis]MPR11049.1 conjugal transfer ATPase VirC1 [Microvirga tunisiensis]MPR29154.1 conjugal transfer ATPase VirC1 [Microvirga tunisiensis]